MPAPSALLASVAFEHAPTLLDANTRVARANLAAVDAFVRRSAGLFRWAPPADGLCAWLRWHGPGSARELAASVLAHDKVLLTDCSLFYAPDGGGSGGGGAVRVGLGPEDMPERLRRLEVAMQRYVQARRARL